MNKLLTNVLNIFNAPLHFNCGAFNPYDWGLTKYDCIYYDYFEFDSSLQLIYWSTYNILWTRILSKTAVDKWLIMFPDKSLKGKVLSKHNVTCQWKCRFLRSQGISRLYLCSEPGVLNISLIIIKINYNYHKNYISKSFITFTSLYVEE